ncbi:hypothetical protein DIE14_01405 [Burkholderia sp. Bp9017]|nr:hypothetical protein DIE14_01405 [Burkholderia sp. Bp9017]RQZ37732.1 hypothetical protein DIE13_01395 [Burkholderia sp. Bp9016]
MQKWLMTILIAAGAYFTWCYFVPNQADRIDQVAAGCFRVVAGTGAMLHEPLPSVGDLIYGQREGARETCAAMMYGFTQGAADLARHEENVRKAANPALYGGPSTGVEAASGASSASAPPSIGAPAPPAIPNANNPGSL